MDSLVVTGGRALRGTVEISGAKNAALPILAVSLLAEGVHFFRNVPRLKDIDTIVDLVRHLGAEVDGTAPVLRVATDSLRRFDAPYDLVKKMRASIYVLGPLLARFGRAKVSLPGGCAWGPRPVNLHQDAMEALGATLALEHGYIVAEARRLRGARIVFDISSVGATGNAMMAAALAEGTTVIENAAAEPEIEALADFLNALGARVAGGGTKSVTVEGVSRLTPGLEFVNIPDRIEAGTFLAAGAITGGEVTLRRCRPDHLALVLARLEKMGCALTTTEDAITLRAPDGRLQGTTVVTEPYPGFPTDLQAQFMALLCRAEGTGVITETIYPDRFTHVPELRRLGAQIVLSGNVATVTGVERLQGARVMSTDIRASSALILGGLAAEGRTHVSRIYHIDRGYERIEERLALLGARIRRVPDPGAP
jgi:UDP-N-acetylglucosamine 1-carboxyvinyltransferase